LTGAAAMAAAGGAESSGLVQDSPVDIDSPADGTMVIRVWVGPTGENRLMARLISNIRVRDDLQPSMVAGTSEEVMKDVRDWLDRTVASHPEGSAEGLPT